MDVTWGQLAKLLGMSYPTLKKIRDDPDRMTRGELKLIVSFLEIPPEEIRQYII